MSLVKRYLRACGEVAMALLVALLMVALFMGVWVVAPAFIGGVLFPSLRIWTIPVLLAYFVLTAALADVLGRINDEAGSR